MTKIAYSPMVFPQPKVLAQFFRKLLCRNGMEISLTGEKLT